LAAKRNREKVTMMDFEDAKDKVYMGLERKSKVIKDEDRKTTAYHEAGHALVARFLPKADVINKITIIPRGRAAGVTWFLPDESDFKYKDQLEADLAVAYGGRVAEEIVFDRISTGASNDIKQATDLAQQMIRNWGMSEELGPLSFAKGEEQVFLGREIAQHRDYSETTAQSIDAEISRLISTAHQKAKTLLEKHLDILHKLSELLLEKETVMGKELDELILSLHPNIDLPSKAVGDEPELEESEETGTADEAEPNGAENEPASAEAEEEDEATPPLSEDDTER
jgi:cell division protease FtsH